MSNQEARMYAFKFTVGAKGVRSQMKKTLEIAQDGDFAQARRLLEAAENEFDRIKRDHLAWQDEFEEDEREMQDAAVSIGYTEIFRDTIHQAFCTPNNGAIRFHVYN